jgi:hypothetical protein
VAISVLSINFSSVTYANKAARSDPVYPGSPSSPNSATVPVIVVIIDCAYALTFFSFCFFNALFKAVVKVASEAIKLVD